MLPTLCVLALVFACGQLRSVCLGNELVSDGEERHAWQLFGESVSSLLGGRNVGGFGSSSHDELANVLASHGMCSLLFPNATGSNAMSMADLESSHISVGACVDTCRSVRSPRKETDSRAAMEAAMCSSSAVECETLRCTATCSRVCQCTAQRQT